MATATIPDDDSSAIPGMAFDDLVTDYYAAIFRYLLRQTEDRELAADLTQETFLDAFRDLHRLPVDRSVSAWLFRIAFNNMRSVCWRSALRKHVSLDAFAPVPRGLLSALMRDDAQLRAVDDRDRLDDALNILTPGLRNALLLHAVGLSTEEVARLLNISNAAAERRISRARLALRRYYASFQYEA